MKFFFHLVFLFAITTIHTQTTISGTVVDSSGTTLPGANVVLLRQIDSSLVAFGSTNASGAFNLTGVGADDYLLRCSFIGYQRPEQQITVTDADQLLDLGPLRMYPEGFLLDGIEVNGYRIPIRMRGDTMVFDADAFAAGPNAVVEDLLRRLPGMTVDPTGAILFNGKAVREVMVNGKPFFRGNSKIVTQNLDAAAVEKVEVFDQKSDQEIVSGVDDGQEDISINLAIKEDAKNQPFGQLYAGGGSDQRYRAGGKAFRIGDRSQLGLIGLFNNTNQTGFDPSTVMGWSTTGDFQFGGGTQGQIPVNWNRQASGDNQTITAGLNYGSSIGDRTNLALSYVLLDRKQRLEANERDIYQNSLFDQSSLLLRQSNLSNSAHRVTLDIDTKADTNSGFDLQLAAFTTGQGNNEQTSGTLFTQDSTFDFTRFNLLDESRPGFTLNADYSRRLGKRGRTLSLEQKLSLEEQQQSIFNEQTGFSAQVVPGLTQGNTIDQSYTTPTLRSESQLALTLPLRSNLRWKNVLSINAERNELNIDYLDEEDTKRQYQLKNEQIQSSLSSSIELESKKSTLNFGAEIRSLNWTLSNAINRQNQKYFWLPQARYRRDIKNGFYQAFVRSDIRVPQTSSLQEIVRPSGGFNILSGNPNLEVSQNYNLINFLYYGDNFSGLNGSIQLTNTYADNPIGNALMLGAQQQQIELINVSHSWNHSLRFNIEQRLDFLNASIGLRTNARLGSSPTIINDILTQSESKNWQLEGYVTKSLNEKSFLRIGYLRAWNRNQFAEQNTSIQNNMSRLATQLQFEFSPKWRFETNFNWENFQGSFANTTLLQWDATVEIRPFAKAPHYFQLTAHDLLNQNAAITQEAQLFLVRSRSTNALGRYLLLSFHWKL